MLVRSVLTSDRLRPTSRHGGLWSGEKQSPRRGSSEQSSAKSMVWLNRLVLVILDTHCLGFELRERRSRSPVCECDWLLSESLCVDLCEDSSDLLDKDLKFETDRRPQRDHRSILRLMTDNDCPLRLFTGRTARVTDSTDEPRLWLNK